MDRAGWQVFGPRRQDDRQPLLDFSAKAHAQRYRRQGADASYNACQVSAPSVFARTIGKSAAVRCSWASARPASMGVLWRGIVWPVAIQERNHGGGLASNLTKHGAVIGRYRRGCWKAFPCQMRHQPKEIGQVFPRGAALKHCQHVFAASRLQDEVRILNALQNAG